MGSKLHGAERTNSGSPSSRSHSKSSGSFPYSSHLLRRCRSTRPNHASSRTLDLNIDREQHDRDMKSKQDHCGYSSMAENDQFLEHQTLRSMEHHPLQRQPSSRSESSRKYKKVPRSCSFEEVSNADSPFPKTDEVESVSYCPPNYNNTRKTAEKLLIALPNKLKLKYQESNKEITSTVEDHVDKHVKEDPALRPDSCASADKQSCHAPFPNDSLGASSVCKGYKEDSISIKSKKLCDEDNQLLEECGVEKDIPRNVSDESEEPAQSEVLGSDELIHMIKSVSSDRRKLASEIVEELQRWIMKNACIQNESKMEKLDQEALVSKIEEEKKDLQLFLERELDMKFCDWSWKCEKLKVETKRLQEHLKDLAEKNASLQREVAFLSSKETENQVTLGKNETQLNDLMKKLEESKLENSSLCQYLTKMGERCKEVEADRDFVRRNFKEKERESKDLQRLVIVLQRTCNDQEKMICGLRLDMDLDIGKGIVDKTDHTCKVQMEQMRLTDLDQTPRSELESLRFEAESLRQENTYLLERLQSSENVSGSSILKLDQELHTRVRSLQDQGLSLLDQSSKVCDELLHLVKCQLDEKYLGKGEHLEEGAYELDYSFIETDMKIQRLKRELASFKMSVHITEGCLHERHNLIPYDCRVNADDNECQLGMKLQRSQVNADFELEAEVLLGRVLREKLWSKERELECLRTEFASFIRLHYILKADIHRLQDSLYYLTNRVEDLELEVAKGNATVTSLEITLLKYQKNLIVLKGILTQVSGERDLMREQVKFCNEKSTLQKSEFDSLSKRVEALEEEILIKEGQITILQDCYNEASVRSLSRYSTF